MPEVSLDQICLAKGQGNENALFGTICKTCVFLFFFSSFVSSFCLQNSLPVLKTVLKLTNVNSSKQAEILMKY